MTNTLSGKWAVLLGSSSGMGAGVGRALAKHGMNILGVHFDRRQNMPAVHELVKELEGHGAKVKFINADASSQETRDEAIAYLKHHVHGHPVKLVLHSLAFGTLKPYIAPTPEAAIAPKDMDMTLNVMAHSVVYWAQDLVRAGMLGQGSRIYGMTSEGSTRVWRTYGAVSAAKCALESHLRQLAMELAPLGVTCNAIRAGVTDTAALRKIPEHMWMVEAARKRNPSGRMTTPDDIGAAIVHLAQDDTFWMTGNIIGLDGGENITA